MFAVVFIQDFRLKMSSFLETDMAKYCIFCLMTCIVTKVQSQTISPFTFNNGGGYSLNMDWNIGESSSVAHFNTTTYNLNSGVLQPMTSVVTAITEYGPVVFGNQVSIGPNPTTNILVVKTRFSQLGTLSIQLLDSKSMIVNKQDATAVFSSYDKTFLIGDFPPGVYYVRVFFQPINGTAKTGIYKVIKQ